MKQAISFLLPLLLVFCLCACSAPERQPEPPLSVGFGQVDITPDFSVGLDGYANASTRRSTGVFSNIFMNCIAMTEGKTTVLLFSMDLISCPENIANWIRIAVSPTTGIPNSRIFCSATHTHSAPGPAATDPEGLRYRALYLRAALTAAQNALADQAPTTVLSTELEIEGMNFVRHYNMSDGTVAGINFGTLTPSKMVDHVAKADNRMTLVKFDRQDDKNDILLVNWAAHPANSAEFGRSNISSDFIGAMRDKIREETGMHTIYFTGASGDVNTESRISSINHNLNAVAYGETLAEHAIAALPSLSAVKGSGIETASFTYEAQIDHSWDHLAEQATAVHNLQQTDPAAAKQLCQLYDFSSFHHARSIMRRAASSNTGKIAMYAFRVGGLGFITGPYEMFSESGMYIKEQSPFDTTIICTGNNGYIATDSAYQYRSYEADIGHYVRGTAEKLAEKYVELLNSIQ